MVIDSHSNQTLAERVTLAEQELITWQWPENKPDDASASAAHHKPHDAKAVRVVFTPVTLARPVAGSFSHPSPDPQEGDLLNRHCPGRFKLLALSCR